MDRSQRVQSPAQELRRIENEVRRSTSVDQLRHSYERIQSLRRSHPDDFDLQLELADLQELVIGRARALREGDEFPSPTPERRSSPLNEDAAQIAPEVERLDAKNWQRAIYIGLFFAVILFAAFFYLIQTARRLNMTPAEIGGQSTAAQPGASGAAKVTPQPVAAPPVPTSPTLRLYTDLVPGSISIDNKPPQDLKDGELVLDNVEPGHHSMTVTGRTGEAGFSYDVAEKSAPRIVGLPTVNNVMAVLISSQNGKARLVSSAANLNVSLDGKPVGEAGTDGLTLDNLGSSDHDLQVSEGNDHQRFVLTYTPAPALTVYIKSDPNTGAVVVVAGLDGAQVYINNLPYRRQTEHGQIRIPNLKVGQYTIRVHKAGFLDPPPVLVQVKKAEETRAQFQMQPVPQIATLQIKGALPGTMVYLDGNLAAAITADGSANLTNVKPGDHSVELRRDGAATKKFQRTFHTGEVVALSGPDVMLEKVTVDNKPEPPAASGSAAPSETANTTPAEHQTNNSMQIEGEQIRRGGGFIPYHTPHVAGQYSFALMNRKGGFLKHGKLQWYAGFQNGENYILFTLDGKHATVRQVTNDHGETVDRVNFDYDSDEWVQVNMSVTPSAITAKVRAAGSPWVNIGGVTGATQDLTAGKVGFYLPGNDEMTISNFRFSAR